MAKELDNKKMWATIREEASNMASTLKLVGLIDFALRKQGFEYKGGDIVPIEPECDRKTKFKEGDWIVSNFNNVAYIESISETEYNLQCEDGYHQKMSIPYIDACWRLWNIEDAKDGDVLATLDYILIFKKRLEDNGGVSYCHYDFTASTPCFNCNEDRNWYFGKEAIVHPATKEQRKLLFAKMQEVGYLWDAEEKRFWTPSRTNDSLLK